MQRRGIRTVKVAARLGVNLKWSNQERLTETF